MKISANSKNYFTVYHYIHLTYIKINFQNQSICACWLRVVTEVILFTITLPGCPRHHKKNPSFYRNYVAFLLNGLKFKWFKFKKRNEGKFCLSNTDLGSRKNKFIFECRRLFHWNILLALLPCNKMMLNWKWNCAAKLYYPGKYILNQTDIFAESSYPLQGHRTLARVKAIHNSIVGSN